MELTEFRGWKPNRFTKLACTRRSSFFRIKDLGDEAVFHATDAWLALPDERKRDDLIGVCRHLAESDMALQRVKVVDADDHPIVAMQFQFSKLG